MANEEPPSEIITVTDTANILELISPFYSKQKFSDVDLLLDGLKIPCHKVILAARSKYFDSLLTKDSNKCELTITKVPNSRVFRKILKYIYTGCITFVSNDMDEIFNVIELAGKYELKYLEKAISEKITSIINMDNVFDVLNKANLYDMKNLRNVCLKLMDEESSEVLKSDRLSNLTQKSMVNLLERNSFSAPEVEIFKSVAKWCTANKDDDNLVMATVRFNSMTTEEVITYVYPTKLIKEEKLMEILSGILSAPPETANNRLSKGPISCEKGCEENLLSKKHKTRIVSGTDTLFLLPEEENVENYAFHNIGEANGITIRLNTVFYINHIYMTLWDQDKSNYSYYVEVSLDQKKWPKIIDYSKYPCRSCQNLYFDKVSVKCVRIVGTSSSASSQFRVTSLKLFLKTNVPKVLNGIICPNENVSTLSRGASVIEPNDDPGRVLNNTEESSQHVIGKGNIVVQLAQPYIISNMKLHISNSYFMYTFKAETSTDKLHWQMAVDYTNTVNSEKHLDCNFDARPVVFIKVTGIKSPALHPIFRCNNDALSV